MNIEELNNHLEELDRQSNKETVFMSNSLKGILSGESVIVKNIFNATLNSDKSKKFKILRLKESSKKILITILVKEEDFTDVIFENNIDISINLSGLKIKEFKTDNSTEIKIKCLEENTYKIRYKIKKEMSWVIKVLILKSL